MAKPERGTETELTTLAAVVHRRAHQDVALPKVAIDLVDGVELSISFCRRCSS